MAGALTTRTDVAPGGVVAVVAAVAMLGDMAVVGEVARTAAGAAGEDLSSIP